MILETVLFAALAPAVDFDDAVCQGLNDIQCDLSVVSANRAELRKINKDFAMGYEAKSGMMQWKEPMKLRLSSNMNGEKIIYIVSGDKQSYLIQRFNLRKNDDLSKDPGRHQTLFDFGLITKSISQQFLKGTFVRTEPDGTNVFDVNYRYDKDKTRYRIWVHPTKKYIEKRVWYNRRGQLMASFEYSAPVQSNGIWMCSRVTVKNAENQVAGVSQYSNIKTNIGLSDSLFRLN